MSIVMEDGEGVVDGRISVRLCRSLAAAGQSIQLDAPRCVPGAGAHPSNTQAPSRNQPTPSTTASVSQPSPPLLPFA